MEFKRTQKYVFMSTRDFDVKYISKNVYYITTYVADKMKLKKFKERNAAVSCV